MIGPSSAAWDSLAISCAAHAMDMSLVMNSQQLREHVRDTVSIVGITGGFLRPEAMRALLQAALNQNADPELRTIRVEHDQPIEFNDSGILYRPSQLRDALIRDVPPLQLVAIQALAEEAVVPQLTGTGIVPRGRGIKHWIEGALAAGTISPALREELHHWRYVRNVIAHGAGVISASTVKEHADDTKNGLVTFTHLRTWGMTNPDDRLLTAALFQDPRSVALPTGSDVAIAPGNQLRVGLADLLLAGQVWADLMAAAGL